MLKPMEAQYTPFDSVEEMLSPETMSELLATPVSGVRCHPVNDHFGLAGGQLTTVETDTKRLVLKRMSIETDWIMFASDDQQCRSVTLWQYGLLDRLQPHLEHKIIACAQDGDGWAILMHDVSDVLFSNGYPMTGRIIKIFLNRLARLHATFWNDPVLNDSALGLCDPASLLDQTALPVARLHLNNHPANVIPTWIVEGWEILSELDLLEADVYETLHQMIETPTPLLDTLDRYPVTLLHGDYRDANLAYAQPDHPIALDWQEATRSLMTIDLAWFSSCDSVRAVMDWEQTATIYRQHLEARLGTAFDNLQWQTMVDLGYLAHALRIISVQAYWYKHGENPTHKRLNATLIREHNQRIRRVMQWL